MRKRIRIKPVPPHKKPAVDAAPLPTSTCSVCKYETNDATDVRLGSDETPIPGDVSLCVNCGAVGEFNDIMVLRPLTDEEVAALHPETLAVVMAARKLIIKRGRLK